MSSRQSKSSAGKVVAAARTTTTRKPVAPIVSRKSAAPKRPNTTFDLNSVISDITSTFTKGLNRPLVLLSVVCVIALVVTHSTNFSSGIVGKWIADRSTTNSLALWVHENQARFLGLAIFLPAVLDSPENVRVAVTLASCFWVMLIPASSVYEYVIQALALHTYFRVQLQNSRIFILLLVGVLYFFGHITLTPNPAASSPAATNTSTQ
nr:hypothetical protein 3 [Ngewotan negevirus]AQM55321.1 hypothetical protein 3 [Ngewotan negevirus]AQM55324.1 hypothetical protein 3 [Ngewotan negevirus]